MKNNVNVVGSNYIKNLLKLVIILEVRTINYQQRNLTKHSVINYI